MLRREAEAGAFSLEFVLLVPQASWLVAEPLMGLCAVSAMCSSEQWEGFLSEWWVWRGGGLL